MKTLIRIVAIISLASIFGLAADPTYATNSTDKDESKDAKKEKIVTVEAGDTLESIAEEHKLTYVHLFNANDTIANPDMIDVGDQIRIPEENEELPARYDEFVASIPVAYTQPSYAYAQNPVSYTGYYGSSSGNTYYQGYCTWYAKDKRPDLPNMLGNGGQWVGNAAAQGYATGSEARAGAIAETTGHVVYVESVNGDGTMNISEMNGQAGFGVVGTRTVSTSDYNYIY